MTHEQLAMNFSKWQSQQAIDAALAERTIAVVGLSSNPARPSHDVAKVMQDRGYRIVPINPRETSVLGEQSYPDLVTAAAATGPINLVNVFRESSAVPAIAQDAVKIGARFLWLQLGVISEQGIAIAEAGGMTCVVDRCLKVEHLRRNARS
jgi:predicted CoA-binding protein